MHDFLTYARGIERLLEASSGLVAIFLGWNLFKVGIVTDQAAEFGMATVKLSLHKVGPGAFFALFGAVILLYGIISPLKTTDGDPGHPGQTSYAVSADGQLRLDARALNTAILIVTPETYKLRQFNHLSGWPEDEAAVFPRHLLPPEGEHLGERQVVQHCDGGGQHGPPLTLVPHAVQAGHQVRGLAERRLLPSAGRRAALRLVAERLAPRACHPGEEPPQVGRLPGRTAQVPGDVRLRQIGGSLHAGVAQQPGGGGQVHAHRRRRERPLLRQVQPVDVQVAYGCPAAAAMGGCHPVFVHPMRDGGGLPGQRWTAPSGGAFWVRVTCMEPRPASVGNLVSPAA